MALIILQQILVMALYMLIGLVLYRAGKMTDEGSETLASLLAYVVIPAMLVNSFLVEFSPEKLAQFGWSFLLGTGTVALSMLVSTVVFRKGGIDWFAAAYSNAGFMGLPLIKASIGDAGVFFLVGMLIPFNVSQWVYGCKKLKKGAKGEDAAQTHERVPLAQTVRQLVLNPMVLASAGGFLLFATGLGTNMPQILRTCISGVASVNAPLAMIVLGVYLAKSNIAELFRTKRLYFVSGVRLMLIPVITTLALAFLPVDNSMKMTMVIASAAPVGANVAIYSQLFGADYVYACKTVTHSTLLSIAVMPLMIFFAGLLIPV